MLRQLSKRIKQAISLKTNLFKGRIQGFSQQPQNLAMLNQWPLGDLFDVQGYLEKFRKKNQIDKQKKLTGEQGENQIVKNLKQLLGKNYKSYEETYYEIQTLSHKDGPFSEYQAGSLFNKFYQTFHRFFDSLEDLRKMRELEDPLGREDQIYKKEDLNQDSDDYPIKRLSEVFNPEEFCKSLQDNQLIIFNIPLNVDENDIKEFLKSQHNIHPSKIQITRCVLNLNSFVTLTVEQAQRDEIVSKLNRIRYNDCLLDVKSNKDAENENAFNRTLIIFNLDRNLTAQEILHQTGQYGRVHNFVIPQSIENEWMLEEDLFQKLENENNTEICEIEVYDFEKKTFEIKYWPSEEQALSQLKQFPNLYQSNYEQTVLQFQDQIENNEDVKRMYRLYAQKKLKCLRVPKHLKQQYQEAWMPQIQDQDKLVKNKNPFSEFFNSTPLNQGFCIITFSSKILAQRALYAINQLTSQDLTQIPLKLINQPEFFEKIDNSHTQQSKYGGRFLIENYLHGTHTEKIIAFKAWEGMELYHLDMAFNIARLQTLRTKMSEVRDEQKEKATEVYNSTVYRDGQDESKRKNEIKDKVYEDLNLPNEQGTFEKYVQNKNFSVHKDLFEAKGLKLDVKKNPGRQFQNVINNEVYTESFRKIKEFAEKIPEPELKYNEKITKKYQLGMLKQSPQSQLIDEREKQILGENNILHEFRDRIYDKEIVDMNQAVNKVQSYKKLQQLLLNKYMKQENQKSRNQYLIGERIKRAERIARNVQLKQQKALAEKNEDNVDQPKATGKNSSKPKNKFGTAITNEKYIAKQTEIKYQQWIDLLERLLYGNYSDDMKKILFENVPNKRLDPLEFTLQYAEDSLSEKYLSEKVIEDIRQFDLPESEEERKILEQQIWNRKELIFSIPINYLEQLKSQAQKGYTSSIISFFEDGLPTEQFKINDDVDGKQMENDLNKYVAGSSEKYNFVEDDLTKERFIVKSEKPYYKYDYHIISQFDQEDAAQGVVQFFVQELKYSLEDAQNAVKKIIETQEYPPELVKAFEEMKVEMSKQNLQQLCDDYGITKRELELHLNNDIVKEKDLYDQEVSEQLFLHEIRLKHSPLNEDNYVRDLPHGIRFKDKDGNFKVPKYKKY